MLHEQRFELSPSSLGDVRQWVRDCCADCSAGDQIDVDMVEIALGEILQNILRYAYDGSGPVTVRVTDLQEGIGVSVTDYAPPSDWKQWNTSKDLTKGGMGLSMIANAVDAFSFRPLDEGNRASIYFFPSHQELDSRALLWIGELLDARLLKDPFERWALWALPDPDPWFSELLRRSIELVERYETSAQEIPQYHNTDHFRDVLVTVAHLVAHPDSRSMTKYERYALVLASILHDYAHPGGVAIYPGEFEDRTITLIKEAELSSGLGSDASEMLDLTLSLIEATSPAFDLADGTSLQLLFNESDVGSSLIPWFGLQQAMSLQKELGDTSNVREFYERFLRSRRVQLVCSTPWLNLQLQLRN
jgi:anti-sigma regulatory factor (Ser/Thr protein kinase)